MKIQVRFYHGLKKYLPPGNPDPAPWLEIPLGTTVMQVIDELRIPRNLSIILMINGRTVEPGYVLSQGDIMTALLPAGGG